MEPTGSLLCSQEPSTGTYPIHTNPSYLSKINFNIIHPSTLWSSHTTAMFVIVDSQTIFTDNMYLHDLFPYQISSA
jgi:hypothetical protein